MRVEWTLVEERGAGPWHVLSIFWQRLSLWRQGLLLHSATSRYCKGQAVLRGSSLGLKRRASLLPPLLFHGRVRRRRRPEELNPSSRPHGDLRTRFVPGRRTWRPRTRKLKSSGLPFPYRNSGSLTGAGVDLKFIHQTTNTGKPQAKAA